MIGLLPQKMLTIPAATAALTNALLRALMVPQMPWDLRARVADLLALDVRFSCWYVTIAKKSGATDGEVFQVLERSDDLQKDVERAVARFETSDGQDLAALRSSVEAGVPLLSGCHRRQGAALTTARRRFDSSSNQ